MELKKLFRKFTVSLIILLIAAILLPVFLVTLAVDAGWATRANQMELQIKEFVPTLSSAPDITKVNLPQGCKYLILDKDLNELYSNMTDIEKDAAYQYAKGEYVDTGDKRQFMLVVREKELCVLQYYIDSRFTASWIPDFFPSPDNFVIIFMVANALAVITFLTAKFAKNLRLQLIPLYKATTEVAGQNLDFEVGHSKIKEFEDVLLSFADMKDSLKASLEQQWKAEQMQREQIAALAHDLKTPLTVIQGNADLICETKLDDEQRLYAGFIQNSSEQMQLYIKTLIELSRAAMGYQLQMEESDLSGYCRELESKIDALCRTKEICLQMEKADLPESVTADKLLLERAIMNVVNNALDYSPKGGTIRIFVTNSIDMWQITVTDEGEGFSQEALLHAKEQFYMADSSRGSELHFGMGLYIAKTIVKQHGGELVLENDRETGGAKVTMKMKGQR